MKKIKIILENCYGIKKLETEFDFSNTRTYAIYAPNGVMKTSFAKTFQDLIENKVSADRIDEERKATRNIVDENEKAINNNEVFVIEPFNQTYESSGISMLLVNKELKEQYDNIYQSINEKQNALIKELKSLSRLKKNIEETISDDFGNDKEQFISILKKVEAEVKERRWSHFTDLAYEEIFNPKASEFIKSHDFMEFLSEYIKTYDQLLSQSTFFKKGIFNHNNASDIANNLVTTHTPKIKNI